MLTDEERRRAAEDILRAERERKAIPQLSRTFPTMGIEDAYRVQDYWAEARIAQGARMVGHKIGLTSRAMQMASKMTEPDYGRILDDALCNDGARIRADGFLKPRLEVELAFIMGEDLEGPGARIYDVMRATEFVVPALEIIDYRTEVPRAIANPKIAQLYVNVGTQPVANSPAEFQALIRSEMEKWSRVIRTANIRME